MKAKQEQQQEVWGIVWERPDGRRFMQQFSASNSNQAFRIALDAEQQTTNRISSLTFLGKE